MQLMDQLSYDFHSSSINTNNNNNNKNKNKNNNNNDSDVTMSNNNGNNNNQSQNQQIHQLQERIKTLQMAATQYKQQFENANKELLEWKTKCVEMTKQNEILRQQLTMKDQQLIGSRNLFINGGAPRLANIQFVKHEPNNSDNNGAPIYWKRTKKVDDLQKMVRSKYDCSKWKIEGDEEIYDYFDAILNFLNENEENVIIPQILIYQNSDITMNGNNNDDDDENYTLKLQTEVLEKYKIGNHPRVIALNGQYGIRARMDIPKHTVVGQYIGIEYLESEFHEAYSRTVQNAIKNIYAFTLSVGDNPTSNKNKSKTSNNNYPKIVIDALGFKEEEHKSNTLIYINDCRSDISSEQKSNDDTKFENVMFAKVALNGWPSIFVITKREIKKGEELLGFYGNDYYHALREKQLQERIRHHNVNVINNVQSGVNLSQRVNLT